MSSSLTFLAKEVKYFGCEWLWAARILMFYYWCVGGSVIPLKCKWTLMSVCRLDNRFVKFPESSGKLQPCNAYLWIQVTESRNLPFINFGSQGFNWNWWNRICQCLLDLQERKGVKGGRVGRGKHSYSVLASR